MSSDQCEPRHLELFSDIVMIPFITVSRDELSEKSCQKQLETENYSYKGKVVKSNLLLKRDHTLGSIGIDLAYVLSPFLQSLDGRQMETRSSVA